MPVVGLVALSRILAGTISDGSSMEVLEASILDMVAAIAEHHADGLAERSLHVNVDHGIGLGGTQFGHHVYGHGTEARAYP